MWTWVQVFCFAAQKGTRKVAVNLESWTEDPRIGLLQQWATAICDACYCGDLDRSQIVIRAVRPIVGPRAGALLFGVGRDRRHVQHAGRMVSALSSNDHAALRSLIPRNWQLGQGSPACYMEGKAVRVEAPWPEHLSQEVIRLGRLARHPLLSEKARLGRWIAGQSEKGSTVTLGLDDATPHFLIAGMTGSGKSVALLSAVSQLAKDARHRIILLDGKYGDELQRLAHVSGLVGPMVTEAEEAKAALGWMLATMKQRYALKSEGRLPEDKVIAVWDEPQEWLKESDLADLLQVIARDGRSVGMHIVLATHHPVVSVFGGPEAKRNFPGRIALRVADMDASRVALGFSKPSAHALTGSGDALLSTPRVMALRTQLAFVDDGDFSDLPTGEPELAEWPVFDSEAASAPVAGFTVEEIAAGLTAAYAGVGRPTLRRWCQHLSGSMPGGSKAQRLQQWCKELHGIMAGLGLSYPDNQIRQATKKLETD